MKMKKIAFISFLLLQFITNHTFAQMTPIGSWQSHFSYNTAFTIELIGDKVYSASTHLRSCSLTDHSFETFSKVNGLSDVGIKLIRYDLATDYMIIVYNNSNIDLMQGNNFYNMPDIKNLNITGSKKINTVFFKNNKMYLSTDFGIVVLDPIKKEIKETYVLQLNAQILNISGLSAAGGYFYAATSAGIFKADESNPILQNFANWNLIDPHACNFIFNHKGKLYATTSDSLFKIENNQLAGLYQSESPILNTRSGLNDFYLCESDNNVRAIKIFSESGILIDSAEAINPRDVVETSSNEIWESDFWDGLVKLSNRKNKEPIRPNGIFSNATYSLAIQNNDLYAIAGGENGWIYTYNGDGFSKFSNGNWTTYNRTAGTSSMDTILDVMDIVVDPRNNYIYAATFQSGLLELHPDNTSVVYKNTPYIQAQIGDNSYRLAGLVMDNENNLWMSNYGAPDQLVVKKADGSWQKFAFPYSVSEKTASQIVIDNANQKWMVAPRGVGIFVLNDNNSIDNKNDDKIKFLRTGAGYGNLPSNEVNCITKDLNGKLWVGTGDGIAIFNCAENIMDQSGCDAELKIVKYDLNAGLLFQRENVRTIAIDGANNKWIGTNNGVWLISDDAEKIMQRFNVDNSPLPSNEINKIAVHPITGDVYFATNAGLVSYRGNATEGRNDNDDMLVFPNPVPSQYSGNIAISGLVANADVRITDAAGQLVYRTKAQGGQATWNGLNYTGKRPRTGVFYVFVTNTDGSESKAGKFIFNE